jgi:hypothetical protein
MKEAKKNNSALLYDAALEIEFLRKRNKYLADKLAECMLDLADEKVKNMNQEELENLYKKIPVANLPSVPLEEALGIKKENKKRE